MYIYIYIYTVYIYIIIHIYILYIYIHILHCNVYASKTSIENQKVHTVIPTHTQFIVPSVFQPPIPQDPQPLCFS